MARTMTNLALAQMFADSVIKAIARGCEHYDKDGRLLATPEEILEALLRSEYVEVRVPIAARKLR